MNTRIEKFKIRWEFSAEELYGYIGQHHVFSIVYDSMSSRDAVNKQKLKTSLPGIRPIIGRYPDKLAAEQVALAIWTRWVKDLDDGGGEQCVLKRN